MSNETNEPKPVPTAPTATEAAAQPAATTAESPPSDSASVEVNDLPQIDIQQLLGILRAQGVDINITADIDSESHEPAQPAQPARPVRPIQPARPPAGPGASSSSSSSAYESGMPTPFESLASLAGGMPGAALGSLFNLAQQYFANQSTAPAPPASSHPNAPAPVGQQPIASASAAGNAAPSDGKSGPLRNRNPLVVVPFDEAHIVHFHVGGKDFTIGKTSLVNIPALYRLTIGDHDAHDAKDLKDVKDNKNVKTGNKYYVEGDSQVFKWVFTYAVGNRSFLHELGPRSFAMLRDAAVQLEMDSLTRDIDWFIRPDPDPEVMLSVDDAVSRVCQIMRLPMVHPILMQYRLYQITIQFLQSQALQHNRSLEEEIKHVLKELILTTDFQHLIKLPRMPSTNHTPNDEHEQDVRPSFAKVAFGLYWNVIKQHLPAIGMQLFRQYLQRANDVD